MASSSGVGAVKVAAAIAVAVAEGLQDFLFPRLA
jgi:uncharacterized protein YjeT (DUF2065 family)